MVSKRLNPITPQVLEKIANGRLFKAPERFTGDTGVYSAQVKDPKKGCSASICTNCNTPIAFSNYTCDACN